MYPVLYTGFDSLDIAFQGAFPPSVLDVLEAARDEAQAAKKDQAAEIGPGAHKVLVKPSGRGSYRYVFNNGPLGAIFAASSNTSPAQWNLFISLRAACLLTRGYDGAKAWLHETLSEIGFRMTSLRINRFDYAVDILASDFSIDLANFVTPGQAKAKAYWSEDSYAGKDANAPKAVLRGRRIESATIGSMPNRQVILYDKRREVLDKRALHWFEVWNVEPADPNAQIWRVEIRAGRDAITKFAEQRSYETVEAGAKSYLIKAARDIRYIDSTANQKNVSRIPSHPLWQTVQTTLADLPINPPPALPDERAREIMRLQRKDMALKQGFGNLLNYCVLEGIPPEELASNFSHHMARAAAAYEREFGQSGIRTKAGEIDARLAFLKG